MNKVELLAKIAEDAKARTVEATDRIEILKLENELNYINSDRYITDQVSSADGSILLAISEPLSDITDKHFSNYQEFNFGSHVNTLIASIKTIMLQKKLGFVALEEAKVMSEPLGAFASIVDKHCAEFPDALGRNSYFDKLSGQIVPGQLGDAALTKSILETVVRELGMAKANLDSITQVRFSHIEERAQYKATMQYEDNQLLDPSNTEDTADVTFKTA